MGYDTVQSGRWTQIKYIPSHILSNSDQSRYIQIALFLHDVTWRKTSYRRLGGTCCLSIYDKRGDSLKVISIIYQIRNFQHCENSYFELIRISMCTWIASSVL
jgi:hypothetical protein